jgi:hypothetical protein
MTSMQSLQYFSPLGISGTLPSELSLATALERITIEVFFNGPVTDNVLMPAGLLGLGLT